MSPPKTRKSLSACPWVTCDKCQATLSQKDVTVHEQYCPPTESLGHDYIKDGVLHSTIEVYKSSDFPKHISVKETHNMVFLSESVMHFQLCDISIGSPVVISNKDNVVVKTAWPLNDKSLTSVHLTKNAMELDKLEGSIKLEKLKVIPAIAYQVTIEPVGRSCNENITPELNVLIKNSNHDKMFCVGNRISIPYYGRKLIYKITNVKTDEEIYEKFSNMDISKDESAKKIFLVRYSTKWIIDNLEIKSKKPKPIRFQLDCIGGYTSLIEDLRDILNIGLGKYGNLENFHIGRGILLYGPSGVGKSMLTEALLTSLEVNVVSLNSSDVYSRGSREIESVLNNSLEEALDKAPSVIVIEDVETLCPRRTSSSTEAEKRVLVSLTSLLDSLSGESGVMVLALTSRPDALEASLRRPGRLEREFEMPVPTSQIRHEILRKLLERTNHNLKAEELEGLAHETHGYVGADLHGLCSEAAMCALKRSIRAAQPPGQAEVTRDDFERALSVVGPSAIKELLIDVPNVKWSDIGGQHELKLKLRQSVEWPLLHADSFKTIGIQPPRGVLMYGPPGCSKTMIAKALATESKLNFLNIKGPELFSKWVGDSEKAVRELFKKARQVAPSIIFIDEIDALGMERSTSAKSGGNSVQERVLTQLLTELDGVSARGNVTLVAATNRPDRMDKALLRPGRFDRLIYVPLPDALTRQEIFEVNFRKMSIKEEEVVVQDLVELTEGYSGAEIQAICNEAGMKALEEDPNAKWVTKEHFKIALSLVCPRTHPELIKVYENFAKNKSY